MGFFPAPNNPQKVTEQPAPAVSAAEADQTVDPVRYDWNGTSKYHTNGCRYANRKNMLTLAELAAVDAVPCGLCNPPDWRDTQ